MCDVGSIYLYYFPSTDEKYVGQTRVGVKEREKGHLHDNQLVDNKMRKHKYCVIELFRCPVEQLNYWEIYFVKELETFRDWGKGGLNLTTGGDCLKEVSEETKKKIGDAHRGKTLSDEHKKKIGDASRGRKHTDVAKEKCRLAKLGENNPQFGKCGEDSPAYGNKYWLGRKHTVEELEKLRFANLGENNPQWGKHPSDTTRGKMSLGHLGKSFSNEHIINMCKSWTAERKKKHSERMSGDKNPIRICANIRRFFKWMEEYCDEKAYIQTTLSDE